MVPLRSSPSILFLTLLSEITRYPILGANLQNSVEIFCLGAASVARRHVGAPGVQQTHRAEAIPLCTAPGNADNIIIYLEIFRIPWWLK